MTKHELTEPSPKCHLDLEEVGKADLGSIGKMLENNAPVVHSLENVPSRRSRHNIEVTLKANLKVSGLSKATKKLYDLEPIGENEKPVKIDLDLYQMEDF